MAIRGNGIARVVGLREKRTELGWSQRHLAHALKMSVLQVYRLEKCLSGTSVRTLFDLVDLLGPQTVVRGKKRYFIDRASMQEETNK